MIKIEQCTSGNVQYLVFSDFLGSNDKTIIFGGRLGTWSRFHAVSRFPENS